MMRMIVGFDPSKAQPAIGELGQGLGPDVEWRVLNLDQNPSGVEPLRTQADQEQHGVTTSLFQRLAGWLGKTNDGARRQERKPRSPQLAGANALELSEEELDYLRHAPARAGTVILLTAPDGQATTVRMWSMRHGGFDLSPLKASEA